MFTCIYLYLEKNMEVQTIKKIYFQTFTFKKSEGIR